MDQTILTSSEERFQAVVAEFLDAADSGGQHDWRPLIDRHPDLADRLTAFFSDQEALSSLARPLRSFLQSTNADRAVAETCNAPHLDPGTELGDYLIRREIGRGGMGIVFEAEQRSLARRVALKVMPWTSRLDTVALQRFRLEAQAAAQLHHPHIVPVFEVGSTNGLHYYVMQRIEGRSLDEWLHHLRNPDKGSNKSGDHPLANPPGTSVFIRAAASICLQAAEALDYAHQRGVVHRDIKPANLLVDDQGQVWIADFGLAKAEGTELTRTGDLVGTLRYMAPERFDGWCDPRSDVYSLGLTLYELLTLQTAFAEPKQERLIQKILRDDPVQPRKLDRRIPVDLETIVLKAIAKEPGDRYRNAAEMAEDLRLFLSDRPIKARRSTIAGATWRWCRRNPVVASLVTSVAALLVVITVGSLLYAQQIAKERDHVKTANNNVQIEKNNVERQRLTAMDNLREAYLAQAHGQRFSGQPGRRFKSLQVLRKAAKIRPGLDLRNEAIACLALVDLRPSNTWKAHKPPPSGVASVVCDFALERYAESDASGGISVRGIADDVELFKLSSSASTSAALQFSPDGRFLVARHTDNQTFHVWDLNERRIAFDIPPPFGNPTLWAQQFFPDSGRLVVGLGDKSLRIFELPSGTELQRFTLPDSVENLAIHPSGKTLAATTLDKPLVVVVELETGKQIDSYSLSDTGHGIAWHPHGKLLAITGLDAQHRCFIFNTETHEQHALLTGHTSHVTQCAFSHGGNFLVTTGYDKTTILWDTASGRPQVRIAGQFLQMGASDRGILYFRAETGTFGIWEVATGSEFRTIHAPSEILSGPWCVDIHPNGRLIATASEDGCRLWNLADGRELGLLPVGNSRTALFLPAGDLITYGEFGLQRWPVKQSDAGTLMQIGPPTLLTPMKGSPNYSNAKLSRDGHRLAAVISEGRTIVLDPNHPDEHIICGPHLGLAYLTLSPDGKWLVTGTQHGTAVKVWDAATGKCVKEIAAGHYGLSAFSLDCRTLVTWSTGHPRQAWDVGTWQTKELADDRWDASAGSRDGRIIAASTAAGILLKDVRRDKELATLTPSEILPVSCLCFSPDDQQLIVSCHNYHAVQVWNLQDIRRQLREMDLDWDDDVTLVKPRELPGFDLTITPR